VLFPTYRQIHSSAQWQSCLRWQSKTRRFGVSRPGRGTDGTDGTAAQQQPTAVVHHALEFIHAGGLGDVHPVGSQGHGHSRSQHSHDAQCHDFSDTTRAHSNAVDKNDKIDVMDLTRTMAAAGTVQRALSGPVEQSGAERTGEPRAGCLGPGQEEVVVGVADDMHLHLRDGEMLASLGLRTRVPPLPLSHLAPHLPRG
jgi:hypothetical protein